jgi:lipoyl-dependent peroxiredoxin
MMDFKNAGGRTHRAHIRSLKWRLPLHDEASTREPIMINTIDQVLYTGRTHTTGGRDGAGKSSDGALDVRLSPPGSGKPGTNPEQLFAVGWSACFIGAMGKAAGKLNVRLPADVSVDAEVDLGKGGEAFFLRARLNVSLPGLPRDTARAIVDAAHQTCPYSKATRGNIDVAIELV